MVGVGSFEPATFCAPYILQKINLYFLSTTYIRFTRFSLKTNEIQTDNETRDAAFAWRFTRILRAARRTHRFHGAHSRVKWLLSWCQSAGERHWNDFALFTGSACNAVVAITKAQ